MPKKRLPCGPTDDDFKDAILDALVDMPDFGGDFYGVNGVSPAEPNIIPPD